MTTSITMLSPVTAAGGTLMTVAGSPYSVTDAVAAELVNRGVAVFANAIPPVSEYAEFVTYLTAAQYAQLAVGQAGVTYEVTDAGGRPQYRWNGSAFVALGSGGSLPSGGTTGQVLAKNSGTDGDAGWANAGAGDMVLASIQTVTGAKTFGGPGAVGKLAVAGTTSGNTVVNASAIASGTLTLPAATDTLVGRATTDTLTNKTLTAPAISSPTGLAKADVGLGNVDNTSDVNKPVSTAQTTAIAAAVAALVASSPGTLDTLNELATALGDDPAFATTMATALALKAPLAGPSFTGVVTTNGSQVITPTAMGALVVDVTLPNTKTIAANQTLTASNATPAAGTLVSVDVTNSDTNPHTLTFWSAFSQVLQAARTSCPIAASGFLGLFFQYTGAAWRVFGDSPFLNNYAATNAPAVGNDNTQGYGVGSLWGDTVGNASYWCESAATGAAVWNVMGGGAGTVTNTGGALTANAVVLGAGTADAKVVGGIVTDGTSQLQLGVAGASVGAVVLANATTGTVTLQPVTGALGTAVVSVPAVTDTLVGKATTDTLTNKTLTNAIVGTQSPLDNSTKAASTGYADAAVAAGSGGAKLDAMAASGWASYVPNQMGGSGSTATGMGALTFLDTAAATSNASASDLGGYYPRLRFEAAAIAINRVAGAAGIGTGIQMQGNIGGAFNGGYPIIMQAAIADPAAASVVSNTTCTISIASTVVIAMANAFVAGQPVNFTTTGALPSHLTSGQTVFVLAAGLSGSQFSVSLTVGGGPISTIGDSQSGVHTCNSTSLSFFMGLTNVTAASLTFTTVEPSAQSMDMLGLCFDSTGAWNSNGNMCLIHNANTGSPTVVSLGASFPRLQGQVYRIKIDKDATGANYYVTVTKVVYNGVDVVSGPTTISTNIPRATVPLMPCLARSSMASAMKATVDFAGLWKGKVG